MTTKRQDFTIKSGESKIIEGTVTDQPNGLGSVVDITVASSMDFGLFNSPSDVTVLLSKTLGAGITITDGPAGIFQVALLTADTQDLSGIYYYEVEMILAGDTSIVTCGTITVEQSNLGNT